jgi:hypothetical protein
MPGDLFSLLLTLFALFNLDPNTSTGDNGPGLDPDG